MNKKRRTSLNNVIDLLQQAYAKLSVISNEEEVCFDNVPDNLTSGDAYDALENNVDVLSDSVDQLETVIDSLQNL